jgi:uncharacterized DUF497 family protein
MELQFEWNEEKAKENLRKHRVSFEEAKTVFNDPLSMVFPDPDHSGAEQRFVNVGWSSRHRVLVVVHTERNDRIRIVSCRRATIRERNAYAEKSC